MCECVRLFTMPIYVQVAKGKVWTKTREVLYGGIKRISWWNKKAYDSVQINNKA